MTDVELIGKVHSAMYQQCQKRGYTAPVYVLIDVGVLPRKKYEDPITAAFNLSGYYETAALISEPPFLFCSMGSDDYTCPDTAA